MAKIPTTSTTLLRDIAQDSRNARWGEFVSRYRPMMEAFLRERFPSLDADDIVQGTLVALCRILPDYRHAPDEKGHFHNYLTGILRNKAIRTAKAETRRAAAVETASREQMSAPPTGEGDREAWRRSVFEIALRQLLADESVHERTREVFRRVAVNGEKPEDVGLSFGVSRNAVDQMKSRMMARLKGLVRALEEADGETLAKRRRGAGRLS
jgi:RNA polymerase sigma factor (sigma-70 family)